MENRPPVYALPKKAVEHKRCHSPLPALLEKGGELEVKRVLIQQLFQLPKKQKETYSKPADCRANPERAVPTTDFHRIANNYRNQHSSKVGEAVLDPTHSPGISGS